jgi:hypothetical protein
MWKATQTTEKLASVCLCEKKETEQKLRRRETKTERHKNKQLGIHAPQKQLNPNLQEDWGPQQDGYPSNRRLHPAGRHLPTHMQEVDFNIDSLEHLVHC